MSELIQHRTRTVAEIRTFCADDPTDPRSGWRFIVEVDGTPVTKTAPGRANLARVLFTPGYAVHGRYETEFITDINPGIVRCDCGELVYLCGFTNTCDCGADYNLQGDRLAPRSQWGYETGESF